MARPTQVHVGGWQGPALFSFGFRPFFLLGAGWACFAMLLWLPALAGAIALPTHFDPVSWHAHEFLFGYLGVVLAGFLLTAVPNWTGRPAFVGWPLACLTALWLAGRITILFSAILPEGVPLTVDLLFPLVLGAVVLREIVASRNWRNLIILALLAVFTLANAMFHIEGMRGGYPAQGFGLRLGVATAILMIAVIGGRIIPTFTRNWLEGTGSSARPAVPMQRFDRFVLLVSVIALSFWIAKPVDTSTAMLLALFGLLHLARMARWQGHHTLQEPLVWVLHVSYAFIPAGALALGLGHVIEQPATIAAQHIWMSGAIGAMTLAVMTRATLGHTQQPLTANRATVAIYFCLFGSVFARLGASVYQPLSYVSGAFWLAAFGGFVVAYGPSLLKAR
ncbi:NnrS family protein [uncultured Tateyamaria sp.]|uniref:NnrS family protein n=1 Tax=uncultured Tateyamaria sp. TaxID=455651 RepID=UPI002623A2FA|nr:NnrS family protein [uncultured Tateyamaria sp.]